jgi:probable rRNA maturation factor
VTPHAVIHIQVKAGIKLPVTRKILERGVRIGLERLYAEKAVELTLVLTDDEQLQAMNRTYLEIDAPTDVLSFSADFTDPDSQTRYLGDILISIPRAVEQAAANGQTAQAEVMLLAVHGVLHLAGYDHAEEEEKQRMWALQTEILAKIFEAA